MGDLSVRTLLRSRIVRAIGLGVVLLVALALFIPSAGSSLDSASWRPTLNPASWTEKLPANSISSKIWSQPSEPPAAPSRYAYSLYATNALYLCNALMIFESLSRTNSTADRIVLHPDTWLTLGPDEHITKLLARARTLLGAQPIPIKLQHSDEGEPTWADSYTKLLAFNQTQYDRVLSLDTDGTVLQSLDDLFLLPANPLAAPLAYWLDRRYLSSQIMLIAPSAAEFAKVDALIRNHTAGDFDMEIVNILYGDTATLLPHRHHDLLTGEFRSTGDHAAYLGEAQAGGTTVTWNATAELAQAKYVHFSDWPVPKPWLATEEEIGDEAPRCKSGPGGGEDCKDRDAWLWMYSDFAARRKLVCDV